MQEIRTFMLIDFFNYNLKCLNYNIKLVDKILTEVIRNFLVLYMFSFLRIFFFLFNSFLCGLFHINIEPYHQSLSKTTSCLEHYQTFRRQTGSWAWRSERSFLTSWFCSSSGETAYPSLALERSPAKSCPWFSGAVHVTERALSKHTFHLEGDQLSATRGIQTLVKSLFQKRVAFWVIYHITIFKKRVNS